MSPSAPYPQVKAPILSDSLSALGLSAKTLFFALNYEFTEIEPTGLLKRFKKDQGAIDLDIACVLYDKHCTIDDIVWFKQLRDKAESVRHQGDSLNSKDRGDQSLYRAPLDQEQIRLSLVDIPEHIEHIAMLVSSYHGHPLGKLNAGEVHLSDDEGNRAFEVNLRQSPRDCSAVWIASMRRGIDDWQLTLQNLPLNEHDISKAAQLVAHELARVLPMPQAIGS